MPRLTRLLTAVMVATLSAPFWAASADDLKPAIAKLASEAAEDRILGLRELMSRKASAEQARPELVKLLGDPAPSVRGELVWAVHELLGEKGTDLLEKLYADPDHLVRDSAVRAACRLFDKPRPRDLCKATFDDPDFAVKIEVLNTLKEYFPRDAESINFFRKGLSDASEGVQRSAVFGVQLARDSKAIPDLARLARKSSDMVAVPAAEEALATIGTPEAVQALIGLLPKPPQGETKPTDNVRAAAARALARVKAPEAANTLRPLINDPTLVVRLGAIEALMEIGDKASVPALLVQLTNTEPRVRKTVLRALRKLKDPTSADAVAKAMREDKEPGVRASAVTCLADILGDRAIPKLTDLKTDLDPAVRLEAAGALAGLGQPAAGALAGFLSDADPSVQSMAIEGIGHFGTKDNIPALAELASTAAWKNKFVRLSVAQALGSIGHSDGIPVLERLVTDVDPAVRQRVATSLGQIGGTKAKAALETLSKDAIAPVRQAAQKALESLGKSSKGASPVEAPKPPPKKAAARPGR